MKSKMDRMLGLRLSYSSWQKKKKEFLLHYFFNSFGEKKYIFEVRIHKYTSNQLQHCCKHNIKMKSISGPFSLHTQLKHVILPSNSSFPLHK